MWLRICAFCISLLSVAQVLLAAAVLQRNGLPTSSPGATLVSIPSNASSSSNANTSLFNNTLRVPRDPFIYEDESGVKVAYELDLSQANRFSTYQVGQFLVRASHQLGHRMARLRPPRRPGDTVPGESVTFFDDDPTHFPYPHPTELRYRGVYWKMDHIPGSVDVFTFLDISIALTGMNELVKEWEREVGRETEMAGYTWLLYPPHSQSACAKGAFKRATTVIATANNGTAIE